MEKSKDAPVKKSEPEGFRKGYDVKWMKKEGPVHPDYYKVFPDEKK